MWELNPNTKIPLIKDNPYLGKKPKVKCTNPNSGCCVFCNNREAILCVRNGDVCGQAVRDYSGATAPTQFQTHTHTSGITTPRCWGTMLCRQTGETFEGEWVPEHVLCMM